MVKTRSMALMESLHVGIHASTSEAGGRDLKRNQASASESGGRDLKRNQASASESGGRDLERNEASASQGSEILRRKKEMQEARSEGKLSTAGAGKTKRMKVVKRLVPQDFIDYMIETPSPLLDEIPEDELAKRPKFFRDAYARCKIKNDKIKAYHRALIDQYNALGYAEDESEVIDDEEEMEEN